MLFTMLFHVSWVRVSLLLFKRAVSHVCHPSSRVHIRVESSVMYLSQYNSYAQCVAFVWNDISINMNVIAVGGKKNKCVSRLKKTQQHVLSVVMVTEFHTNQHNMLTTIYLNKVTVSYWFHWFNFVCIVLENSEIKYMWNQAQHVCSISLVPPNRVNITCGQVSYMLKGVSKSWPVSAVHLLIVFRAECLALTENRSGYMWTELPF